MDMDRKDKWWRSTTEMQVAREVITFARNTIKYKMTRGDKGKWVDACRR